MPADTSPDTPFADTPLALLADPRFDHAQALAAAGHVGEALAVYEGIGTEQAERHYRTALALAAAGDAGGALAMLRKCVAADGSHADAWLNRARLSTGAEAERACREVLALVPGQAWAQRRLVDLLVAERRLAEAIDVLVHATAAAGSDLESRLLLAQLYVKQGDFPAAERQFMVCIAQHPADVRAYLGLVEVLDRLDRVVEIEEACRAWVAANDGNGQILLALAQSLARQGRFEEAGHLYERLLEAAPASVHLRQLYAAMLLKSGRGTYALAIHEKNVELAPRTPEAYLQLADTQRLLGQPAAARATLAACARLYDAGQDLRLEALPVDLVTRLVFDRIDEIAARYCTGTRALVDHTGLRLDGDYAPHEVVELFCMVVGREHVEYLEHVAFPALVATEGFEEMTRRRRVVYNLYTSLTDLPLLDGFLRKLSSRGLPFRINVEMLSFTQDLYPILCLPIIDQVRRSLAMRSVVVMALPDAIFAGPIAAVIDAMGERETVVCAMPRIDAVRAYPALRDELRDGRPLDARRLVRRSFGEFLHPQSYSALRSESNCLKYTDTGSEVIARNWAPPPLAFEARPEMLDHMLRNPAVGPHSLASFYAIDHDVVASAHAAGRLRLVPDSDTFFWAEFTHPDRHTDFLAGRKGEDFYYPEASKAIYAHAFRWIYADAPSP